MRLIDADTLKAAINNRTMWCNLLIESNEVLDIIDKQPDIGPVRRGKWINHGSFVTCSVCNEEQYGIDTGRFYCPNCGAKMEEEE